MFDIIRGGPDATELKQALSDREEEIRDLQEQLRALQDADQRDFLNDNSDQLAEIIKTKNKVIQDLQASLQNQGQEGLAQAVENARLSAEEVQRLRAVIQDLEGQLKEAQAQEPPAAQSDVAQQQVSSLQAELAAQQSKMQVQEKQLQIYRAENDRQASEIAATAATHAMEVTRLQASLQAMTERASRQEGEGKQQDNSLVSSLEASQAELSTQLHLRGEKVEEMEMQLATARQLHQELAACEAQRAATGDAAQERLLACERALTDERAEWAALTQRVSQAEAGRHEVETRAAAMQQHLEALSAEVEEQRRLSAAREQALSAEAEEQRRLAAAREEALSAKVQEQRRLLDAQEEADRLQSQLEIEERSKAASNGLGSSDAAEVGRLKAEVQVRSKENKAAQAQLLETRKSLQEVTAKAQRLEAQLARSRMDQQEAEQKVASMVAKGSPSLGLLATSTGVAGAIAQTLQDVELGQREGVSLQDLGLSELTGLVPLDRFLQLLSALMAVRADARLAVFGIWMLCHLIYVIYLVYEHFIKR